MKFSVIIPCHNPGRLILDALASVERQTVRAYEIIVINDGSVDGTKDLVKSSGIDVKYLETDYGNAAAARNAGIRVAEGDWLAFLDADDVWYGDHLLRASRQLGEGNDVGRLNRHNRLGAKGEIRGEAREIASAPMSGLDLQDYIDMSKGRPWFPGMSGCIVSRERAIKVGLLDVTQYRRHDIEFWLRVINGNTWSYDPAVCHGYRIDTPGAISRNIPERELYLFRAFEKNYEVLPKSDRDRVMGYCARRAMSAALTEGSSKDRAAAWKEVCGRLSITDRALFQFSLAFPDGFSLINRLRRKLKPDRPHKVDAPGNR